MPMSEEAWLDAADSLLDTEMNETVPAAADAAAEQAVAPASGDTPELKIDGQGRPHDAATGRFVSLADPGDQSAEEAEEGTPEEPEEVPEAVAETEEDGQSEGTEEVSVEAEEYLELDPDHPFFSKYGGDPEKALKALEESQSMVGRQSGEVGELRKEIERLTQLMASQPDPRTFAPYQNDAEEDPAGLAYEVVERAMETNSFDEATYQRAIQAWGEEEPFQAAQFDARVQMAKNFAAQAQQAAPQPAAETDGLQEALDALKQRAPDLQENWPQIEKLAAERPVMRQALYDGTAQERAQALEDLNLLARSQRTDADTFQAVKKVILRAKAESDQALSDAQVVGASRTSSATTRPKADDMLEKTLRSMLEDDSFVIE